MDSYQDPAIGKEVDGYRILEVLGQGGMGIVYKAEDVNLSRMVALKMIDPGLARDEAFLRRFRAEARALARIDSRHIVSVHALRETDLGLFIVMEFVDGGTVSDLLEDGPMAWEEALPVILQTLSALEDAHSVGVWHRDIKPGNILISKDGKVKVTDFGLAKLHQAGDGSQTVTQGISGTLYYMSPEQVKGGVDLDHRTDLYSAGMMIYKMLAGRLPFDRSAGDFAIMRKIVEEPVPRLDGARDDLPPALVDAVEKALRKDPDDRFATAREMRRTLEGLAEAGAPTPVPDRSRDTAAANTGTTKRGWLIAVSTLLLLMIPLSVYLYPAGENGDTAYSLAEITTDPEGATVMLDGDVVGESPVQNLQLERDEVTVRVQKEGYAAVDTVVLLQAGSPAQLSLTLAEEMDTGTLRITSTPEDANVYVNGEAIGVTPFVHSEWPSGIATIRLEKEGYEHWEEADVEIASGEAQHVAANLEPIAAGPGDTTEEPDPTPEPEPATLLAEVHPTGTISVAGRQAESSGTFQLQPDTHQLVFSHPEHGSVDTTLQLSEAEQHNIAAYFEHEVNINTDGPWASIRLNGESIDATTPRRLNLGPGTHVLHLRIDGRDEFEIDGGVHRIEVAGEERFRREFTGNEYTLTLEPAFQPHDHFLIFRTHERSP